MHYCLQSVYTCNLHVRIEGTLVYRNTTHVCTHVLMYMYMYAVPRTQHMYVHACACTCMYMCTCKLNVCVKVCWSLRFLLCIKHGQCSPVHACMHKKCKNYGIVGGKGNFGQSTYNLA